MPRLFVAVWPPEEVLDKVAALNRPPIAGLRWTTRDQWHVTLRFLGAVDDPAPVLAALARTAGLPAADASLGPATDRFGQRILHVPVGGLDALAAEVVTATHTLGRPPDPRPFSGHLTLARVAERARADLRPLTGVRVEAGWAVKEVCVVESHPASTGARYEVRGTVPCTTSNR